MTALVDSFGWARTAYNEVHDKSALSATSGGTNNVQDATALMLDMKRAMDDYECAATLIEGFSKSSIKPINISASGSSFAYRRLIALQQEYLSLLRTALDGKTTPQGTLADKITDNAVQQEKAWEMLLNGATAATFALIVEPASSAAPVFQLNITVEQRRELNAKLEKIFGDAMVKDEKELTVSPELSGRLLYDFINRRDWLLQK